MEIIREGPSASRLPVLDGKNYSYWKPQMIFFIKTLDGKAWRALVAGYDPPMITVNGVSVPKPEVDWTDAEEQASVGNARALNTIFNGVDLNVFKLINSCSTAKEAWKTLEVACEGTSKVKISRLQLITYKFEALRMTEDESVSDYNKRVLEIANESLLLGEKIPDSKLVRKVLRSFPKKLDMKVTATEEAHDITTLKLDELFGSLLTFEMATANRESKKGKGIAFKSTHVGGEAVSNTESNMDDIEEEMMMALPGGTMKILIEEVMVISRKRKVTEGFFKCRECGGVGHYQAECPTYLRKQKKNFRVTLSDEESGDSRDDDRNINAFTIRITDVNSNDDSECSEESKNDDLTIEKHEALWKEDCEARAIQKERIQDLIKENECLMSVISSIKLKLREFQNENDQILKSVKMLNSGTENLDLILKSGHNGSHRHGLGFVASVSSSKATSEIKFVPASMGVEHETIHIETGIRTTVKYLGRTCYYCGRKGHIRSICYKLRREQLRQQKYWNRRHAQPRMVQRIKSADRSDREYRQKWDAKSEQGIFLGYSQNCRTYRVFNNISRSVMETINVVINDHDSTIKQINDEEDETPNMSEARTTSIVKVFKADNLSDDPGKSLEKLSKESITKKELLVYH
ncbi:gag-proteinase polyprotein [Cucumis melo var. makuwa]|uniref:Gag-proteinase polyprotein n=1 Tax=Cucumis melo var. makuwa TaxID=1194695 RepID=A0A5D3BSP9_CUCMM|nr:gag-proteinase polyprotein [Cucumis melo var. makuwa]